MGRVIVLGVLRGRLSCWLNWWIWIIILNMNKLYQKIIITQINYAIAKAEAIGDLKNPGLKGRLRKSNRN